AGFGRGQSGAAGPFAPAEQAWLAKQISPQQRGRVYSLNSAIGFLGMGFGALAGGMPHWFRHYFSTTEAFRPVFLLIALISLVCLVLILKLPSDRMEQGIEDEKIQVPSVSVSTVDSVEKVENEIKRKENRNMVKLSLVNIINGLAVGLINPLMAYWFSIKYGVGTAEIGVTLSISFFLTSFSSIFTGFLADRFGLVKSVTFLRVVGVSLMFLLPFIPTFLLASVIFVARNALNRGTQGARSALNASLTRDKRRGLSTSVGAISSRLPSSVVSTLTGAMLDVNLLLMPFILSSGIQLVAAVLYQSFFKELNYKNQDVSESKDSLKSNK
ncbi:MAG TPA: MFS transporter, partial [Candidatus Angelobacter sp.]|nr:MFS transporter [Candidatus Angelobacter sp.]